MKTSVLLLSLCGLCSTVWAASEPDFGPNVTIFAPDTDPKVIQEKCDQIFKVQFSNQFGAERNAVFFKPGTYNVNINVGFYTQFAGLGTSPDDVRINGVLQTKAFEANTNVTQNFWRSCENFSVKPPEKKATVWAVSQAAPMRRMHLLSDLRLFIGGWASGGFLSDSKIDGKVVSGSQQQWLSRNCEWGSWQGGVWNMAYMGVVNAPSTSGTWDKKQPHTAVEKTPVIREKPYLTIAKDGSYGVFVPAEKKDSVGVSWKDGAEAGKTIPLGDFHIAHADKDTAASMNAALAAGKHLLLTPGVYRLDQSLQVTKADTIVLGIGMASLKPHAGTPAIEVADVDGVRLAGLLIDAGAKESPALVQIGAPGSSKNHAANPICLYDIFCRIGGAGAANVVSAVVINSNDVIGDHAWIWRADHGEGAGWESSKSKNGLVVNGARVSYYGLFVEHFQEYQTLWNGDDGYLFFYQCEIPYDVPSTEAWSHGNVKGWAGYKVGDAVKKHTAGAMGIYSYFRDAAVTMDHAIEVPQVPGVTFKNVMNFWLTGKDEAQVLHVINDVGAVSSKASRESRVPAYPVAP